MLNFEGMSKEYRERVYWDASDILDKLIMDHLVKGGQFDAQKITKMFGTAVRVAQLTVDLEIGTGLNPLREEKDDENGKETSNKETQVQEGPPAFSGFVRDEVCDLGKGNPEGPTGCDGNAGGLCDTDGTADQVDNNRSAGIGEVNASE